MSDQEQHKELFVPCTKCGASVGFGCNMGKGLGIIEGAYHLCRQIAASRLAPTREVEEAKKYLPWQYAGGPNECKHGYAEGIPCPDCDAASPEPEPQQQAEGQPTEPAGDFLYSRNKWHMLCNSLSLNPASTCVADVLDKIKPQAEEIPKALVSQQELDRMEALWCKKPDDLGFKCIVELQQWRKWAAAKGGR